MEEQKQGENRGEDKKSGPLRAATRRFYCRRSSENPDPTCLGREPEWNSLQVSAPIKRGRDWKQKAIGALVISPKPHSSLSSRGGFSQGRSQVMNHKAERGILHLGQLGWILKG